MGSAGAKAVETQGVFIVLTLVGIILTARIKLAEDQFPVEPLLSLVIAHRHTAAEIFHFDRLVLIAGDDDLIAVPFPRFVDGVGKDLENRVLATVQPIGPEDNTRTQPNLIGAF